MVSKRAPYELHPFTRDTLASTELSWKKQLEKHADELLASNYIRILGWAKGHLDYECTNGDSSIAYGIFADGTHHAAAIVEIIYTKRGKKWLKLLDINLSPAFDLSLHSGSFDVTQLSSVFGAAVLGSIKLTATAHPAKVMKLYGRSTSALAFLKGFGIALQQKEGVQGLEVSVEGRWLVFRSTTKGVRS
jgi:hypothetical protein